MQRNHLLLLCTLLTFGCDGSEEELTAADTDVSQTDDGSESTSAGGIQEADDPELANGVDPAAAANTDPLLQWVLYAQPGVARLVKVDPATGAASTVKTHSFASHWTPVGVAGNKLLWQRSDTGEISLWTIDSKGNYMAHQVLAASSTWKARGISFDQEGQCPTPPANKTSYTILLEGPAPANFFALWPKPQLWHVNDGGTVTSTESFPTNYPWAELRDFRLTADGYGALVYQNNLVAAGNGDGTALDWYGRKANGTLQRLRTDAYSAADGYRGCTAHVAGVQCGNDYVDAAPGAGHKLTSMVTTATAGGNNLPASYLLWTKTDGTAKSYRLALYSGKQLGPAAPVVTPHLGTSAVSFTGRPPQVCPLMQVPQDPPELPGAPVLDPPGCPWC